MMPHNDLSPCVREYAQMYVSVHKILSDINADGYDWQHFTVQSFIVHCEQQLNKRIILMPYDEIKQRDIVGHIEIDDAVGLLFYDGLTEPARGWVILEMLCRSLMAYPPLSKKTSKDGVLVDVASENDEIREKGGSPSSLAVRQHVWLREHTLTLLVQTILNRAMYGLAGEFLEVNT